MTNLELFLFGLAILQVGSVLYAYEKLNKSKTRNKAIGLELDSAKYETRIATATLEATEQAYSELTKQFANLSNVNNKNAKDAEDFHADLVETATQLFRAEECIKAERLANSVKQVKGPVKNTKKVAKKTAKPSKEKTAKKKSAR